MHLEAKCHNDHYMLIGIDIIEYPEVADTEFLGRERVFA